MDNKDYSVVTRNSHYYAMAHMGAVVKPGAVRIGVTVSANEGFSCAAFENTDGSYALVVVNNSPDKQNLTVNDEDRRFCYTVPANAVASFKW